MLSKVLRCSSCMFFSFQVHLLHSDGSGSIDVDCLSGMRVAIFCGIAKPWLFRELVSTLKAQVVAELFLEDHIGVSPTALEALGKTGRNLGADMILCTEKDAVKLVGHTPTCFLPIGWLELQPLVIAGLPHLEALTKDIADRLRGNTH